MKNLATVPDYYPIIVDLNCVHFTNCEGIKLINWIHSAASM